MAIVAIVANFLTMWITLRTQRRGAHTDRIWNRKVETYEEFVSYCTKSMKERHEYANGQRQGSFEVEQSDPDDILPLLDRMLIYSSEPVRATVQLLGDAEVEWRQAYGQFLDASQADDEDAIAETQQAVKRADEKSDAMAQLAMTLIKQELVTGYPARRKWIRRLKYVEPSPKDLPPPGAADGS